PRNLELRSAALPATLSAAAALPAALSACPAASVEYSAEEVVDGVGNVSSVRMLEREPLNLCVARRFVQHFNQGPDSVNVARGVGHDERVGSGARHKARAFIYQGCQFAG